MSDKAEAKDEMRPSSGGENGNGSPKIRNVRLVLFGDTNVGKTCIALRFVKKPFVEGLDATIGVSTLTQTINVSNQTFNFVILDTAGLERYHFLGRVYYRLAQAAVVVYDVTNSYSFNRAIIWVNELRQQASAQIIIVLVGNKADMPAEKRAVSRDEAQAFAKQNSLVFIEASAKTGMCVDNVFMVIGLLVAEGEAVKKTPFADPSIFGCDFGGLYKELADRKKTQTLAKQVVASEAGGPGGRDGGLKIEKNDKNDEKTKGGCCVIQ